VCLESHVVECVKDGAVAAAGHQLEAVWSVVGFVICLYHFLCCLSHPGQVAFEGHAGMPLSMIAVPHHSQLLSGMFLMVYGGSEDSSEIVSFPLTPLPHCNLHYTIQV
jgi:hypothetical protein